MVIELYKTKSEPYKVDKVLTDKITLTGEPSDAFSIVRPSFNVGFDVRYFNYNYAYIPALNRYYWLDSPVIDNEEMILSMNEDYRMTWKTDIRNATARVTRSASNYDNMIVDNMVINKANTITYQRKLGAGFTRQNKYLVLIGG